MKILVLLFTILAGFCFACKDAFDYRRVVAERQQLIAYATAQPIATQAQAIVTL
ncbi:hypothetical protein [Pontibacter ummariensis]|uniref:hypothetical protein n=1 Tax=Pontibacter ummariensis TaxID=1610492 RepID=UPI0015C63FD6|nr:hypothetical protein [Pontibacter ummariensis]